ncbi:hypothetical protein B6I21_08755, partial [candidate division KSB1 bacterium 4572_119]
MLRKECRYPQKKRRNRNEQNFEKNLTHISGTIKMSKYKEIDLTKIKTYSIKERPSKVDTESFARRYQKGNSVKEFLSGLPDILIGADFKQLVDRIVSAVHSNKQIILMMGAHVIKCGLNPILIQLMETGVIKCLTLNGAGVIHDFEVANWGKTSEDVGAAIDDGSFGMVQETPRMINNALKQGQKQNLGFGEAV